MTKTTTHGMSGTPVYQVWSDMRRRCNDHRRRAFKDYGGRGIKVCKRWDKFENFFADMGDRPSPNHQLDRMNNDRGYYPSNCVWTTRQHQSLNRRSTKWLKIGDVELPVILWAKRTGINHKAIHKRLKMGWTPEEAISLEVKNVRKDFR
jgi:hypothetical protein